MKVKWLGHASFIITSESGTRIITDPYATGGDIHYGDIDEAADIITVSHDHFDHNNVAVIPGSPEVVRGTTEARGIKFKGIPTYHDDARGSKRGSNTIICFKVDGVNVCHLGDLGHTLGEKELAEMGEVDVLLIPVGGYYTIDAAAASKVCEQIKPRAIIPMHFKNEKLRFPIDGVDEFLRGKRNVTRADTSEVEFKSGAMPTSTEIIVLQPAL